MIRIFLDRISVSVWRVTVRCEELRMIKRRSLRNRSRIRQTVAEEVDEIGLVLQRKTEHIDIGMDSMAPYVALIQEKKLRGLAIADDEQARARVVRLASADQLHQLGLHRVGVLKFVDEHRVVASAHGGAHAGIVAQQIARGQILRLSASPMGTALPRWARQIGMPLAKTSAGI